LFFRLPGHGRYSVSRPNADCGSAKAPACRIGNDVERTGDARLCEGLNRVAVERSVSASEKGNLRVVPVGSEKLVGSVEGLGVNGGRMIEMTALSGGIVFEDSLSWR